MINWTEKRLERLKLLHKEGFSASAIAKKLGPAFTKGVVAGKIRRLGLKIKAAKKKTHPQRVVTAKAAMKPRVAAPAPKRSAAPAKPIAAKTAPAPRTVAAAPVRPVPPMSTPAARPVAPAPVQAAPAPAARAPARAAQPPRQPQARPVAIPRPAVAAARAGRPAPAPIVVPAPPPQRLEAAKPVTGIRLYDLREGHCRWPVGDDRPTKFFCGGPALPSKPWCEHHYRIAYGRAPSEQKRPDVPSRLATPLPRAFGGAAPARVQAAHQKP
jgi:GcrA cell cycle regulator